MSGSLVVSAINGVDISVSPVLNETQLKGALNASGTAPIYACRAWVNFNGTGTVVIRASGNISSIADNGVGDYTANFTTAMPDANYSATIDVARTYATLSPNAGALFGVVLVGSIRMNTVTPSSGAVLDMEGVFLKIHR